MPEASQNAVDRVCSTTDLLVQIFYFIPKADSARCTRVCRRWQDVALDHVWRDMDSIYPLLSILAPLEINSGHQHREVAKFTRGLQAKDWERFATYASRVKCLALYWNDSSSSNVLDESVFVELACSRRMLHILPNLSTLKMGPFSIFKSDGFVDALWMKYAILFLHASVRVLEIATICVKDEPSELYSAEKFFEEISERSPSLASLVVDVDHSTTRDVSEPFSKLLSRLTRLEILEVNWFVLTPKVIKSLAPLPKLKEIRRTSLSSRGHGLDRIVGFRTLEVDHAFPQLESLTLIGNLKSLCHLFSSQHAFQNLAVLDIGDVTTSRLVHLLSFFHIVSNSFHNLRRLRLRNFSVRKRGTFMGSIVAVEALEPLAQLTHMEVFKYDYNYHIDLTDRQFVDIFGCWHNLHTLRLYSKFPPPNSSSSLTLAVLSLLSVAFPMLKDLELYVDAVTVPSDDPDLFQDNHLRKLTLLDLGASPIDNPKAVAMYLSRVLTLQCVLVEYRPDGAPRGEIDRRQEIAAKWKEVKDWLPSFIGLHEVYLKATRSVRDELCATRDGLHASRKLLAERDEQIRSLQEAGAQGVPADMLKKAINTRDFLASSRRGDGWDELDGQGRSVQGEGDRRTHAVAEIVQKEIADTSEYLIAVDRQLKKRDEQTSQGGGRQELETVQVHPFKAGIQVYDITTTIQDILLASERLVQERDMQIHSLQAEVEALRALLLVEA